VETDRTTTTTSKIMRTISLTLILLSLLLVSGGCKRRRGEIASTVFAGDPAFAGHFTSGFYNIEANAWRWTNKEFAVTLNPPLHSAERGAQLVMHVAVPDASIQLSQSVQLSCSIGGLNLDPQTFSKGGTYTYVRDVPPDRLQGKEVRIDFAVDHTAPPQPPDVRQLGIIVSEVGLVAK
jgi:hypothetical protein